MQRSPEFGQYRQARQVVEHRLARLVQLGIRQARYVGRMKTLFQLLMAATVANLTLLASRGDWESWDKGSLTLALSLLLLGLLTRPPASHSTPSPGAIANPPPPTAATRPPLKMAGSRPHL